MGASVFGWGMGFDMFYNHGAHTDWSPGFGLEAQPIRPLDVSDLTLRTNKLGHKSRYRYASLLVLFFETC